MSPHKEQKFVYSFGMCKAEGNAEMKNLLGGKGAGVAEMTRFGMKEKEMAEIARFFKLCLREGKYVGGEVEEFRKKYQKVYYSFDDPEDWSERQPAPK